MEAGDASIDHGICEAIDAAVKAGVFRAAGRKNTQSVGVWNTLAEPYSRRAATLLADAIRRLGAEDAGPFARGEY